MVKEDIKMEPNKDELLNSIRKGTVCDNELLKKVYGYDLSFEGFAEKALKKLEEVGGKNVREDYKKLVSAYEKGNKILKEYDTHSKKEELVVHTVEDRMETTNKKNDEFKDVAILNAVEEKEMKWLIPEYLPRGQIAIIAGEGGCGKTNIWCALATAISAGRCPFLIEQKIPQEFYECEPEKVMFFSAEDSVEYVLIKRLKKNGANLDNLITIDIAKPTFKDIKFNSDYLVKLLERYRPSLCVFDPIQSFLPEQVRMSERNSMRNCMEKLVGYGEKYGTTFLIVVHTNKQAGVWGRKRIADSADIWDISRSVFLVGTTKEKGINYISHEKCNYAQTGETVLYSIADGSIEVKGYSTKKDRDFIIESSYCNRMSPCKDEAKEFVLNFLKDGKREVAELEKIAVLDSISKNALRNAKEELKKEKKIRVWSEGFTDKKYYIDLVRDEM